MAPAGMAGKRLRFHEVHHLDRFLDSTSAVRFHFGEMLLSAGARAIARLFRTRSATVRTSTMPIGVEGHAERALPELLSRPFRPRAD